MLEVQQLHWPDLVVVYLVEMLVLYPLCLVRGKQYYHLLQDLRPQKVHLLAFFAFVSYFSVDQDPSSYDETLVIVAFDGLVVPYLEALDSMKSWNRPSRNLIKLQRV